MNFWAVGVLLLVGLALVLVVMVVVVVVAVVRHRSHGKQPKAAAVQMARRKWTHADMHPRQRRNQGMSHKIND